MENATEIGLLNWREGQTKAERLAANLLELEGFTSIDPQSPLGGRDGIKDIICEKSGWNYIGAVYFPPTLPKFKDIKEKFINDLKGVKKNEVNGIVFITNQRLTPSERKILDVEGNKIGAKVILYHVEKIRIVLDSPKGFALRLAMLGIEMTKEEQLGYFVNHGDFFEKTLKKVEDRIIEKLSEKIEELKEPTEQVFSSVQKVFNVAQQTVAFLQNTKIKSDKKHLNFPKIDLLTKDLNVELLLNLHKAILFETDCEYLGQLRTKNVWIGSQYSLPSQATFIPPDYSEILSLIENLLKDWRDGYPSLELSKDIKIKIKHIALFHSRILGIHPFIDGNGRLARFLLMQQVSELLDCNKQIIIEDNGNYYIALQDSHNGNHEPIIRIITQAVFGSDEIIGQDEDS